MNRIIEVKLTLQDDDSWIVAVTKEFAPEYGGGTQTFVERAGRSPHYALDVARGMVTVSPGYRTDLQLEEERRK